MQSFRYSPRWTDAHIAHYAAGLSGSRLLAAAAGVSYALDFSGRSQWSRALLPRSEGANAVARVHPRGERERTLVLWAHIDAAQTGLMWHPALWGPKAPSPATLPLAAFVLAALGRKAGRAILGLSLLLAADVARHRAVPGANDNACAAAGLVDLIARFARDPLERTEVIAVATGCEESGMGGAAAWLRRSRGELPAESTLVLGLDQIGAGDPHVVSAEGPPLLAGYAREDVDFAGLPEYKAAGWTDPIVARFAGLRAISLVGVKDGTFPNYHRMTDTPDRVDFAAAERCLGAARDIARRWDG